MTRREALKAAAGYTAAGAVGVSAGHTAAACEEQPIRLSLPGGRENGIGIYPSTVAALSKSVGRSYAGRTRIFFRNSPVRITVLETQDEVARLILAAEGGTA